MCNFFLIIYLYNVCKSSVCVGVVLIYWDWFVNKIYYKEVKEFGWKSINWIQYECFVMFEVFENDDNGDLK